MVASESSTSVLLN